MAEVLVLVEHTDGEVKKVTGELLTLAARLGEPSAVFIGSGFDAAKESLAAHGAAKVYVAEGADVSSYLVAPVAEVLAKVVADSSPAAVLSSPSTPRRSRRTCSSPSFSATRKAHSPVPRIDGRAASSSRIAARCSSTKSAR